MDSLKTWAPTAARLLLSLLFIVGGLGSIVVALLWMRLFPTLRDVEKLS